MSARHHRSRVSSNRPATVPTATTQQQFKAALNAIATDDFAGAARLLDSVLLVMPQNPDARCLRGICANHLGDHDRAVRELRRGLRSLGPVAPDTCDAYNEFAIALRGIEQFDEAEHVLRDVLAVAPDYAEAWHNLALVLQSADRLDEAVGAARRASGLQPENAGALLLLGKMLRTQGRLLTARSVLERAHAIEADDVSVLTTLGNTYFYLGEIDAALACFRRTTELHPDEPVFHSNYATMLTHCRRYEDATREHDRAFELAPRNSDIVVRRAALLLNLGRLREGWEAYEHRLEANPRSRRWTGTPHWNGGDLTDKTLCVYREQGIGDEIMFAGCYDELADRARHLVVECDPRLEGLLRRSFPNTTVVAQLDDQDSDSVGTSPARVHPDVDIACAAGSVLQYLRTDLASFPDRRATLVADPDAVTTWRNRLEREVGPGPYIGISWRSMIRTAERRLEYTRLDEWGPILRHADAGAQFVLLQYDQCEREVAEAERRFGIRIHRWHDLDLMNDFDNVAALITNLDLVIAPRNAVAMLSGALGAPTLAIGNVGDWAECGTGQLPWFTSLECVNRRVDGAWTPVLTEVATRVTRLLAGESPVYDQTRRKATV